MSPWKYDRSVTLLCPVCGSAEFEHDAGNANAPIRCTGCNRIVSRESLIDENQAAIVDAVDEIKGEVISDFRRKLRDAFRGSGWKLR